MNSQFILFTLLACVFALLIWGRWRYDLVAFGALTVAVIAGVVPTAEAFTGFGHPATVIVALVLIISRGLSNSGAIELAARYLLRASLSIGKHIALMSGFAAALSAVMNNVAALALLMPLDMEAAARARRSPAATLMPLSFASILGGMITLIGTPPNIVISQFRGDTLGEPYRMFDFAPVGLACAIAGLAYITTIGWRLIPAGRLAHDAASELYEVGQYVAELTVAEASPMIGARIGELEEQAEENGAQLVGLIRGGRRLPGMGHVEPIQAGDVLVVEAAPAAIDKLVGLFRLDYLRNSFGEGTDSDLALVEAVVPENARIAGRSALSLRLLYRHDVTLLGVSREGARVHERVRRMVIRPGDVLLLLGPAERIGDVLGWLGCLPLAGRSLQVVQRDKASLAVGVFGAAVLAASLGWVYLPVALAAAAVVMVLAGIVPLRQIYESVEWPVVVLLGSMIPIGAALETSGGTAMLAGGIVSLGAGLPPAAVLALLIAITMTLSDVMNNTATAVIAAPVAVDIAQRLGVSPDPFLMGVAVAASCAFLTPIGHKNNTLIMGPGGYRFGDYWRMGLPLELLIIAISTPAILWAWPL